MTYVVADPCVKCKYTDCVAVCPVDCFYEGANSLVIHPDECIDCGACEPECPTTAIFEEGELPEKWNVYMELNAVLCGAKPIDETNQDGFPEGVKTALAGDFAVWPVITEQKDAMPDADAEASVENKLDALSPSGPE